MKFEKLILASIYDNARKSPESNSFCINDHFYTYGELISCVNKIRNAVKDNDEVYYGLVTNNDLETYASIIALWSEGKCYVPLHPAQPIERCLTIVDQVNIKNIIDTSTDTRYGSLCVTNPKVLCNLNEFNAELQEYSEESAAYILFTSGSTGVPKGVVLSRRNLSSFIEAFSQTGINIGGNDRCLQCFDLTFDVSVQAFLYPLINGACVYTVPYNAMKFLVSADMIDRYKLTFMEAAPSMIRFLKPYFADFDAKSIKYCILTAEASDLKLAEEWIQQIPDAELYDFYGPTEATIYCTYYKFNRIGPNKSYNGSLSIGKPLPGVDALIVDVDKGTPLPVGEKGELCVAGGQVTSGYWDNKEKTAQVFYEIEGVKYYKTGDLCYMDEDGDILYSGRLDFQTKIQGFRVELGEIDCHVKNFLPNKNVVTMTTVNQYGNTEIVVFVETNSLDVGAVRAYLENKVPPYMVPTHFVGVEKFPLNANYKVDRNELKKYLNN